MNIHNINFIYLVNIMQQPNHENQIIETPCKSCTGCGKMCSKFPKRRRRCFDCIKEKNKQYYAKNKLKWQNYNDLQDEKNPNGQVGGGVYTCSKCHVVKPCKDFYNRRKQCKGCMSAINKERRKKKKERKN
jgi:hypothetical protein